MNRKKEIINTAIRHIVYAFLLMGIIFSEIYMYLRSNSYIEAFEFKDIFFKGGTLDNLRFYDMRMTAFYLVMQFVRITGISDWRADNEQREAD